MGHVTGGAGFLRHSAREVSSVRAEKCAYALCPETCRLRIPYEGRYSMLRKRPALLSPYALVAAIVALQFATPTETTPQETQPTMPSYETIFRVPIPATLPDHPRVFCTSEEIARIKADLAAGDVYTGLAGRKPSRREISEAATLAQAYILTDNRKFGERARDMLLAFADICPTLETTRAAGRFTDSTLIEGPVAVDLAMAYDLVAGGDILTAEERAHIEQDLLRVIAWESGHGCHHRDSSNWRSWGLTVLASCGFAIGDRELIEEAINGIYDPKRKAYLYGIVQQLTHSIFSDGIHWERSIGYTYYTASALMYVMEAAKNSGIDLWHAKLPGIMGPFKGSAGHEEYGPPGDRSIKAFLDAPFYYAFADGSFAQVGDSGSSGLGYHPIYELAYAEYRDPKYAWLINDRRSDAGQAPAGWSLWRPRGNPHGEPAPEQGRNDSGAFRLTTPPDARIALVQNVTVPAGVSAHVSGWVRALSMDGGSAHIRANFDGKGTLFSNRVTEAGDWREVTIELPPREGAGPDDVRSVRLHVFLEGGAGEVLWDDISVQAGDDTRNVVRNPDFGDVAVDGRRISFWDLLNSVKEVPAGEYSLAQDATIGISGRHENGCTLFPVGGFAILRDDATDLDATAVNLAYGPYGSGHDHPDRLHFDLYGLGKVLGPDAGSWGYNNPMHLTWANQSIAHNTLTVDEVAQAPQGKSKSIWAGERGDQRVFGVLRLFHPGPACSWTALSVSSTGTFSMSSAPRQTPNTPTTSLSTGPGRSRLPLSWRSSQKARGTRGATIT